ncbi:MAG: hypothetical protein IJZ13_05405 [Clostridia bacterium]|nr:hypothetical protein [Clostridia bacterium]
MPMDILKDTASLRSDFMETFLMPWSEYMIVFKDFIADLANKYHTVVDKAFYDRQFMWDRVSSEHASVSFVKALELLRAVDGEVLFMSEEAQYHDYCELLYEHERIPDFIAKADARELAELIEYEWFEEHRLAVQDMYRNDIVLPRDLYVFTPAMNWLLIFTHETTEWEVEVDDPLKAAESRLCIACGFDET